MGYDDPPRRRALRHKKYEDQVGNNKVWFSNMWDCSGSKEFLLPDMAELMLQIATN